MRVRTELSEKPREFSVVREGNLGYIRFFTDVQEEQREEGSVYTADMWEMSCPWTDSLETRVETNPELWLAKVKAITTEEESAAKLEELKRTATDEAICDLASIVADLMDAVIELAGMIT